MKKTQLTLIAIIATMNLVIGQSFTDSRDGNVYQTVTIGNQIWMAENLKYLPEVKGSLMGSTNDIEKYYYVYGYEGTDTAAAKLTSNYNTYGVLYNFAAATNGEGFSYNNEPEQGVCPTGWHLPTDGEWDELRNYIGGIGYGGKLKAAAYNWNAPNTNATNETGFSALPGGYRVPPSTANFSGVGELGSWWSSSYVSGVSSSNANATSLYHNDSIFFKYNYSKASGYSVRCVKTICDLNLNIDTSSASEWICHNAGAAFQWLFSSDNITFSPIISALDSTYTPTQTGYYAVEINKGLCLDTTSIYYFQGNTGIETNSFDDQIHVYPNPSKDIVTVDLKNNHQITNVLVTDLTGKIVFIYYFKNIQTLKVDLTSLISGVYILTIKSNETNYSARIIKE